MDGYKERSGAQALTGEWIVYAKHNGRNYYLTLGKRRPLPTFRAPR